MSHGRIGIFRTKNPAALIIALFFCLSTPCYALDVGFSWNVSDGATGYKVYYNTFSSTSGPPYNGTGAKEGPSPIDVNNLTQFTLHNLSDGGYRFAVTAYNNYGESGYSTEAVLPPTQYPPSVVAGLPFTEDFESGNIAECWEIRSTGAGRTLVTTSDNPHSGSYHLTMDSSQDGTYSLNELILTLDLSGQSGVILGFHHKEFSDEDHVMPDRFSGSHNSDGVAISPDGTTWYRVQGLTSGNGISSGGTFYEGDLDSAVTAWGIDYNSSFKIKFQHYDNYSIDKDGFAFDDIEVYQIISDADHDGLPDDWELFHFNNLTQEPEDDLDYDELNNLSEYQLGTKPSDSDSDSDGMLDGWEVRYDLDPINAADADEDLDGDGQTNLEEYMAGTDPTLAQSPSLLPFSSGFDSGSDGFVYTDNTFRGTTNPSYASGNYTSTEGFSGGGLHVALGGIDNNNITDGMSGGWSRDFSLSSAEVVYVTLRYRLTTSGSYESDECSQALVAIDGNFVAPDPEEYLEEYCGLGNGNSDMDSEWRQVSFDVFLPAGSHTLSIGGWNNKKTYDDEVTDIYIDDIVVTQGQAPSNETNCTDGIDNDGDGLTDCGDSDCAAGCGGTLFSSGFDSGSDGFVYTDNTFRGTANSSYASGNYTSTQGFSGGGLHVALGGIDNNNITDGMSGGWSRDFSLSSAGVVNVTLSYRLTTAWAYESDECSQALVAIDGNFVGPGPEEYLEEYCGLGDGNSDMDSEWRQVSFDVSLPAGSHTLSIGGWNNKKTYNDEVTDIYIDDIAVTQD